MTNTKCSKMFWLKREKNILFRDYSISISEAKYKAKYGERVKILSPKEILQRLSITLAQVRVGNTSKTY